jgi:hypothetical protein
MLKDLLNSTILPVLMTVTRNYVNVIVIFIVIVIVRINYVTGQINFVLESDGAGAGQRIRKLNFVFFPVF